MSDTGSNIGKYMITFALGAVGGGLLIAWATKAMPKMMSGIMQNMMANMRQEGCGPMEM